MKTCISLFLLVSLSTASAATYYADASRPDDSGGGTSWATAKKTIQAAVDLTVDGDTVLVTNGTYNIGTRVTPGAALSNRVVVTNAILVRSVNGAAATVIEGSGTNWWGQSRAARCVFMTNGVLEGFTLRGGTTLSTGGVAYNMYGGAFCGSRPAVVRNSILTGNVSLSGGGSSYGRLENCLITDNFVYDRGGGAHYSALVNCTVARNVTSRNGGGIYDGTATNCIVWGNFSRDGYLSNYQYGTLYHSCTCPRPPGSGNTDVDPLFADEESGDFRLTAGSPCLDAGDSDAACGESDVAGSARIQGGTVDMGAIEGSVTLALPAPAYVTASEGTYTDKIRVEWAAVEGATHYRVYRSPFEDGARKAIGDLRTELALDDTGTLADRTYWYWVLAAVGTNGTSQSLLSLPDSGCRGFSPKWFVDAARPDDSGDGRSWETAKCTIQAAADAAAWGDCILVTDGVYNVGATLPSGSTLSNRVSITNGVTVRSVNGAAETVIEGSGTNAYGTAAAVRCVRLSNGVLDGFTLRGGATRSSGNTIDFHGGGAYIGMGSEGTVLRNCVLSGNIAYNGGASYYGVLVNTLIQENVAAAAGGGAYAGELTDCAFTNNRASSGGATYMGVLNRCVFSGNVATNNGGGSYEGTLSDCAYIGNSATNNGGGSYNSVLLGCTLKGNRAKQGGGAFLGNVANCQLVSNTVTVWGGGLYGGKGANCLFVCNTSADNGGGAYNATLVNSALLGNVSFNSGGGAYGGTLVNCTLADNVATNTGGGVSTASLWNSIVYSNKAAVASNNTYRSTLTASCTTPLPPGVGNLSADPLLLADQTHLAAISPCVAAGDYAYCSGTDIDGEPWLEFPGMGCDQIVPAALYRTLTVVSAYGGADPAAASVVAGTVVQAAVTNSPLLNSATQAVCVGASVVGNAYRALRPNQVSLTLTNDATLTWDWQASFLLSVATNGNGTVSGAGWYGAGSNAVLTATPAAGWSFNGWSGDTPSCTITGNEMTAPMNQARSVVAAFDPLPPVATPVFTPSSGTVFTNEVIVTIECATEDATIRYTLDGTEPAADRALYTGPLTLDCDTTVKARAFKEGWPDSAVATAAYDSAFTRYYADASRPDDSGDGLSWATAKQTIQAAVDLASAGDTVLVTNGVYNAGATTVTPGGTLSNRVVVTNAITVQSVNGAATTIIEGSGTNFYGTASALRCVFMTKGVLDGFTLRSGATLAGGSGDTDFSGGGAYIGGSSAPAEIRNCFLTGNRASYGGGASYCRLTGCTLTGNTAELGGGACDSRLTRCALTGNTAELGGGACDSSLTNCLLTANSAEYGGGSCGCTLNNCTLTGNAALNGGGSAYDTVRNGIVWGNVSPEGNPENYAGSSFLYSCTAPPAPGIGNIAADPLFAGAEDRDYRLLIGSPCLDAGDNAAVSASIDLAGNPRIVNGTVDMGAYEGAVTLALSAPAGISATDGAHTDKVRITWDALAGATHYRLYRALYQDGLKAPVSGWQTNLVCDDTAALPETLYWYWIKAATNALGEGTGCLGSPDSGWRAFSAGWYVDAARTDDSGDGRSWTTAKRTIQAAVDAAAAYDAIFVTNGVYNSGETVTPGGALSNRVVITKPLAVKSVNGAAVTVIEGSGTNCYGTASAIRCVFLTDSSLDGFTLSSGTTSNSSLSAINGFGGGAYAFHATLRNCVLTNNRAAAGGGSGYGSFSACQFLDNSADYGGGSCYSTLTNCTLAGNAAYYGGGVYGGMLVNCALAGNTAQSRGGASHGGTLVNCMLVGNESVDCGGGASSGTLLNCTLTGNTALSSGGGTFYTMLNNCALNGNIAYGFGGGASGGTLVNCTLAGNTAASGGGTYVGKLKNCIVYYNTALSVSNNCYDSDLSFSCTTPLAAGEGNIATDPLLADAAHIGAGSPCIGTGSYTYCSGPDIDGEPWLDPPCMGCDQFAAETGSYFLAVVSAFGGAIPAGATNRYGTVIDAWVTNSPLMGTATQFVCVCGSVVGGAFTQNSETNVSLTLTNNATLTWNWQAKSFLLSTSVSGDGTVDGAGWYGAGSNAVLTATPAAGSLFASWSGDTGGCAIDGATLTAPMTQARSVTARFILNEQAATPTFTPPSGTVFSNTLSVTITCATGGVEIRYTTDGSEPDETSPLYTEPLTLYWDTMVKAKAFTGDRLSSAVATATFDARLILYADASRSDDSGDGRSWAAAKRTIQAAVDLAQANDRVLVTNGVYAEGGAIRGTVSNRVAITNAITVRSVNGPVFTVIVGAPDPLTGGCGTNATRCACLSAGFLAGFTLTNGYTRADGDINGQQGGGGALITYSGVISNCVAAGCKANYFGGGIALNGGSAWNCVAVGNTAGFGGGGFKIEYGVKAYNCLIWNNYASDRGGGAQIYNRGAMVNCTLMGNTAKNGGGVYVFQNQGAALTNCIVYYNTATVASNNCYAVPVAYSCTIPQAEGAGNITNAPLLTDSGHLAHDSPCFGTGYYGACKGTDIDGQAWRNPPCMGCDQLQVFNLTIVSEYGGADPSGVVSNFSGSLIHAWVTNSPIVVGVTQRVCVSASVTGSVYQQVSPTHVSLILTNDATLTWNWETSFLPFTFSVTSSNTIALTGYTGSGGSVDIPAFIGDKAVTSIRTNAFAGCVNVTGLAIPSTVTNIGAYAFSGCSGLTSVLIPSNVLSIGASAFGDCASLLDITVHTSNPNYSSADGVLFNKAMTILIQCPGGKPGSYTLPSSVTSIGGSAFRNCSGLSSVKINSQVTSIGNAAFEGCSQITKFYFLGNAPSLGLTVFSGVSLATVYFVPGTLGWGTSYGGLPTAPWNTQIKNFVVQGNSLSFDISGPDNQSVLVRACTNLVEGLWVPLSTLTLTNGSACFCETALPNPATRFYRVTVVPEPDALLLILVGAAALGLRRRRSR